MDSRPHKQITSTHMDKNAKIGSDRGGRPSWIIIAVLAVLVIVILCLVIAVITLAGNLHGNRDFSTCSDPDGSDDMGLIDLAEPSKPEPFHDLTKHELQQLRRFLENDPDIQAVKSEDAKMMESSIYMMDLYPAKKTDVLKFLDGKGKQPDRKARVIMFRGDKVPPVVEEYVCGPLPKVSRCQLLLSEKRRNPVEFSLRPFNIKENDDITKVVLPRVDEKVGHVLRECFGTSFVKNCDPAGCFSVIPSPVGTNHLDNVKSRRLWIGAAYSVPYYILHPVDFGLLLNLDGSNPHNFTIVNVWYNGQLFDSLEDLDDSYTNGKVKKLSVKPPRVSPTLFSTMTPRGDPVPKKARRAPTLVEPDGRRYSLKARKVDYLDWSFNFRMSALTGPSLFDVRYKGERIAYELGLSEIGVFYSANSPMLSVTNYVDSGVLIGSHSKSLVPGGDCPESASFVNLTVVGEALSEAVELKRAFCLFENNNGYPLRRHLSYSTAEGGFYGGVLDSVLTLRSAMTIVNYDYILDFIFHQNGVLETRVMSTGYIFPSFFNTKEEKYGFRIEDNIVGNIHHHIFHFKADVDIHGRSNRYETLDIKTEPVRMKHEPHSKYYQTKFERSLKRTELEAVYKYNFNHPRYHVIHNNAKKTRFGELKSYRIGLSGMSKQLLPEDRGHEGSVPWARYQLAVTKHKDDEAVSSSPYAMWDSYDPVTNFSKFIEDDENLIDEDLVLWITQGMHHIPHTEDLPVTPTVGNHLTFYLFPYNYFEECPSMSSRDQIHIGYKDGAKPNQGLKIDRYGNNGKDGQCVTPNVAQAYDQLIEDDPDVVIQSKKTRGLY